MNEPSKPVDLFKTSNQLNRMEHIKKIEDHMPHFIERVLERYGIKLSEIEYHQLCNSFHGVFKKNTNKTLGYVLVDEIKVWCL